MKVDDYITSQEVSTRIKRLFSDKDEKSLKEMQSDLKVLAVDSYNMGFVEGLGFKKKASELSDLKKSKELTNLTPSKFKNTETCNSLVDLVLGVIETNSVESVLNVGYELFVKESLEKAFQVAYATGLTAGFGIASDPTTAAIYMSNEERILKQGIKGNK